MKKTFIVVAMLCIMASMFAVLLNEGFEGTTFPPEEWQTAGNAWQRYTSYYHTGTACVKSGYSPTGDWWLITPRLTPQAGANTLTFWYRDYSSSTGWDYVDEYTYVMVSTTNTAVESFTQTVWTGDYLQFTETWQQASVDLSAYNGQNIYIAFKSVHTGGNYRMVDDVTGINLTPNVTPPNPAVCVSPVNGATNVMVSSNLVWATGGGMPTGYRLFFGTDGGGTTPPTNIANNVDLGLVTTYDPAADLSFMTTYYWQVVPYNANGSATGCPIWSFTTGGPTVLMTNGSINVPDGTTFSFYDSGGPTGNYQNSENYTFTFLAANPTSSLNVVFTAFNLENNWDFLKIYDGPTTASPQIGPTEGYTGTNSPGTLELANAVTFVFTSDSSVPYAGWEATVTCNPSVANDLQAVSITGNLTPSVGSPAVYDVVIRNRGTAQQTTYSVKIMSGTTELASAAGLTVAPAANVTVPVTCNFTTTGAMSIFGKVVLTGDQNPANDATPPITVNVQPAGVVAITIGAGDQQANIPLNFYWMNSLYECIYMSSEINMGGLITGISFYNNFTQNLPAKPTKIWLGETTQTDLAGGWIPSTQLTPVFDGTVDYPIGANTITISFTTPYTYNGGNLVMMANRPMDTQWYNSTNRFNCQTIGTNRALEIHSDGTTYDPANPPTGATLSGQFPQTTIFILAENMGAVEGTVSSGGQPLEGATVSVVGSALTTTTNAQGFYRFSYVSEGQHQITCSKIGYVTQTQTVTIIENQTVTLNFNMVASPTITVTGTVHGSDNPTAGLADATVALHGILDYNATTNASGQFTINNVLGFETYNYTISKPGYGPATGSITVQGTAYNMGSITLNEMAYPPTQVQAVEALPNVNITWAAPNPNAVNITESFEEATFPPEDWSQVQNNTDALNTWGVGGTWIRCGVVGPLSDQTVITPSDGSWQCGMWWSYNHQDEWIITPQFTCPAGATLSFHGYIFLGSPNNDHYYVEASTNNGADWTHIWDAVAVGGGAYSDYTTPIVISLDAYAGQQLKLAWHADDPPSNDGMWNVAFFDQVAIGTPTRTITFNAKEMEIRSANPTPSFHIAPSGSGMTYLSKAEAMGIAPKAPVITATKNNERSLQGYKVWRLLEGQETNEAAWTLLTANTISATAYQDTGWNTLPDGWYKWAVKAVYSNNVLSTPAISNHIQRLTQIGTIAGVVRQQNNTPIAGATITAGTYTATSNATGAYTMQVPAGTYTVTCTAAGYQSAQQAGVVVVTGVTTTVNFTLQISNEITDSFETYGDFVIDFPPWVNVDVDQSTTYGYQGYTWTNEYQPQAFMVFNPSATTPSSVSAIGTAHTGNKMAMCWCSVTPPNNDWLISQQYTCGGQVTFYAKAMSADFPAEQFYFAVSTGGTDPANFTNVSPLVTTTTTWQLYTYPMTNYIGQNIRVAIHCVSNDQFALCVDDVVLTLQTGLTDPYAPIVATVLNGNYPNPFGPETTISFSVKDASPVLIEVYNLKGQKVKTLVNEAKSASGNFEVKWNGTDENNQRVSSGVYFYKMKAGKYTATRKMIMLQ